MRVPAVRPVAPGRNAFAVAAPPVPRHTTPARAAPPLLPTALASRAGNGQSSPCVTHVRRRARHPPTLARSAPLTTPPALADAFSTLAEFLAVPAQRDAAAAVFAAVLALLLVKACDLAATRDWLDRVRRGVSVFFCFFLSSQPAIHVVTTSSPLPIHFLKTETDAQAGPHPGWARLCTLLAAVQVRCCCVDGGGGCFGIRAPSCAPLTIPSPPPSHSAPRPVPACTRPPCPPRTCCAWWPWVSAPCGMRARSRA